MQVWITVYDVVLYLSALLLQWPVINGLILHTNELHTAYISGQYSFMSGFKGCQAEAGIVILMNKGNPLGDAYQ